MPREDGTGGSGRGYFAACGAVAPHGRRFCANAAYNGANEAPQNERTFLNRRAELLENQLGQIKDRLNSPGEES